METIGERIRSLRKEKKISQKELAEKIGISNQVMYTIEKDVNEPSTKTLIKLSEILEETTDYILTGKSETAQIKNKEKEILNLIREDKGIMETLLNVLNVKKKAVQQINNLIAA